MTKTVCAIANGTIRPRFEPLYGFSFLVEGDEGQIVRQVWFLALVNCPIVLAFHERNSLSIGTLQYLISFY